MFHEKQRSAVRTSIPFTEPPVFVTKKEREERTKVSKKTKDMLKLEIEQKIASISEDSAREAFQDAWYCEVLLRKSTKSDYLAFYEIMHSKDNSSDYSQEARDSDDEL